MNNSIDNERTFLIEMKELFDRFKNQKKNNLFYIIFIGMFAILLLMSSSFNFIDILLFVVVIYIHDFGHFIGFKLFNYSDSDILMLPIINEKNNKENDTSAFKKGIVILLGSIPGIIVGILLLQYFNINQDIRFFTLGILFLLLNAFSLIPLYPLDGGRLLNLTIYQNNYMIELIVTLIVSIALISGAILFNAIFVAVFIGLNLVTLKSSIKISKIVSKKREILIEAYLNDENEFIYRIKKYLDTVRISKVSNPSIYAQFALQIKKKLVYQLPSLKQKIILLSLYIGSFVATIYLLLNIKFS